MKTTAIWCGVLVVLTPANSRKVVIRFHTVEAARIYAETVNSRGF